MRYYYLDSLINIRGVSRVFRGLLKLARYAGHLDLVSRYSSMTPTEASIYALFEALLRRKPYYNSRVKLVNDLKRVL